ncbi:MAG: hypothetical protein AUH92_04655 [Acidobacteria bacterium 13_1_40CM_4_69_4]|nr:MAG: hypothetical protein AUH92_04655 [Acidobacteria bacterium 13_1_40CM_4_69_4]
MLTRKSALALLVGAVLTATLSAATTAARKPAITVGDFAVKLTKALGNPATDQRAAVASLKSLGVQVGSDLSAGLTEGAAARILGELGMRTTTTRPDNPLSAGKADQLAALAGLTASPASPVPDNISLPTACLELRNRGQCDTCCTNYLASIGVSTDTNACAKFCHSVLPPGQSSPDEPQP